MLKILVGAVLALTAAAAAAQDYPAREIRSICNFTAGSGADIIVRYYSDKLSKLAGRPVIVENRPGAQGLVATDYVAKSRPDGYTILITPASSTLATAPHIFKQIPFDPLRDFVPVTTLNSLAGAAPGADDGRAGFQGVRHLAVVGRGGAGRHAAADHRAARRVVQPDQRHRRDQAVPRARGARHLPRLARVDGGAPQDRARALEALRRARQDRKD